MQCNAKVSYSFSKKNIDVFAILKFENLTKRLTASIQDLSSQVSDIPFSCFSYFRNELYLGLFIALFRKGLYRNVFMNYVRLKSSPRCRP